MAENMDVDILADVSFVSLNDISVRPAKQQIIFSDGQSSTMGMHGLNQDLMLFGGHRPLYFISPLQPT